MSIVYSRQSDRSYKILERNKVVRSIESKILRRPYKAYRRKKLWEMMERRDTKYAGDTQLTYCPRCYLPSRRKRVLLCVDFNSHRESDQESNIPEIPRETRLSIILPDRMITIFQLARAIHWLDVEYWLRVDYTKWFIFSREKIMMIYKATLFPR